MLASFIWCKQSEHSTLSSCLTLSATTHEYILLNITASYTSSRLISVHLWMANSIWLQALEIAAKSQGENISDRVAGLDTVLEIVSDKDHVIKDVDYIDLYEFALSPLSLTKTKYAYSDTIGVLRSRAVRALPKDRNTSLRCLTACLYNADWLHAQEVMPVYKNRSKDLC